MRKWTWRILASFGLVTVLAIAALAVAISYDADCPTAMPVSAGGPTMKAVVRRCYGAPDVLTVAPIARPTPIDDQLLVRVRAAAINPLEWHQVRGTPYLMRLSEGIGAPKNPRIGRDFAGVVAAVGGKVTRYKVGDEIFGGGYGALSEYILVRENGVIARKPANVSFEQAAGVYVAGITALQALRDGGGIRPGDEVLINGASGGVGTFAVQIARSLGAQVTARNRSFDAILDNVANRSLLEIRRVLKPKGKYLVIGGGDPAANPWIGAFKTPVKAAILSRFIDQDMRFFLSDPNRQDLLTLAQLIATGQARPVVDRRYRLTEIRAALRYLETGRAR